MQKFNASKFWNGIHHDYSGLQAVGYVNLGPSFNYWMYRVRENIFQKVLENLKLSKNSQILDIGSGVGFYPSLFKKWHYNHITASDFADEAIGTLKKIPKITVKKIDIGSATFKSIKYDLVTCFDMLYHIVDEKAYHLAFKNLGAVVKPGGILMMTENFLPGFEYRSANQNGHSEKEIFALLKKSGFELQTRQPIFFLMNKPIASRNPILKIWWWGIWFLLSLCHYFGLIIGPILYPFEIALSRIYRRGPSTEMLVLKKI